MICLCDNFFVQFLNLNKFFYKKSKAVTYGPTTVPIPNMSHSSMRVKPYLNTVVLVPWAYIVDNVLKIRDPNRFKWPIPDLLFFAINSE